MKTSNDNVAYISSIINDFTSSLTLSNTYFEQKKSYYSVKYFNERNLTPEVVLVMEIIIATALNISKFDF